jgi:DNA-binding LacI/PurR family transcriptional regulator
MSRLVVLTAAEQVAAHLRGELLRGTWSGLMPGGDRLAAELGIGRDTVEAALRMLEEGGLLVNQGRRRGRLIAPLTDATPTRRIRVVVLPYESMDRGLDYIVELRHGLSDAGHSVHYSPKSLTELGMDLGRVARMVEHTEADAWVVIAGSREVLEWFAAQGKPAFAVFGRRRGLRIASVGPDKPPAMAAATRTLLGLGHSRIVLLVRQMRRLPKPGAVEQAFLDTLAEHGISPGPYHLPDWVDHAEGYHARLQSLFRHTPPTALIVDEVALFTAAQQFIGSKGLRVPEDVSLVSTDYDTSFEWCRPRISHIRWDTRPVVKRVVRWANHISRGKEDFRQTLTPAEFVEGGTIGPV